jgi:2-C-methyl-D-erythritol 4-phosphate cytidylyltransferase
MNAKKSDPQQGEGLSVVIVAGGSGTRMRQDVGASASARDTLPKQFMPLRGVPVLVRTLRRMLAILPRASFIVVVPEQYAALWAKMTAEWGLVGTHTVCAGGKNRWESVRNAVQVAGPAGWIAVHDGVRPLASPTLVRGVIAAAAQTGAAIPVAEIVDTLREVTPAGSHVVDRNALRAVQTPQVFDAGLLRRAYELPFDVTVTDDAVMVERLGVEVRLAPGDRRNIKITSPLDMVMAGALLDQDGL